MDSPEFTGHGPVRRLTSRRFLVRGFKGNRVAVVLGADSLSDVRMAAFASWTNLSGTSFRLTLTTPEAD